MNLAKVALYLEYIAFNLRREETMSKQKSEPSTLPLSTEGFKPSQYVHDDKPAHATEPPAIPAAAQESPRQARQGAIVKDPELVAMNEIAKAMGHLGIQERERVLNWLVAKYCVSFALQSPPSSPTE